MKRLTIGLLAMMTLLMVFLAGWRVGYDQSRDHYAAEYARDHAPLETPPPMVVELY